VFADYTFVEFASASRLLPFSSRFM